MDLKKRLPSTDAEPASRLPSAPDERASKMVRKDSLAEASKSSAAKPIEDGNASSDEDPHADDCGSQDSDEEDLDIFRDRWALQRHKKDDRGSREDRLTSLPARLSKQLGCFDSSVLESIPDEVSESPA